MDPQETTHGRKPCYGDTDMKETTAIVLSNVRGGAGIVGGSQRNAAVADVARNTQRGGSRSTKRSKRCSDCFSGASH